MADFIKILDLFKLYDEEDNGPLKMFWRSYFEMVSLLLTFIRATREGNWPLHLECIREMLPWYFAYDHVNYARYLPVYLMHMIQLPETHPEAQMMLENGDFGVQRNSEHGFSQLPVDQTIEQTLNRSTKTNGGIVGFSLKKNAVQRWLLTAHSRARFVDKCRMMTSKKEDNRPHKEAGKSRMKRDEEDVSKVMEVVSNWTDPFEPSEELASLSSGCVVTETIKLDLLAAKDKGTVALTAFVEDRLLSDSVGFFDPLSKLKLGTFRDLQKKTTVSKEGKTVILRTDRNLFARLLVIGQSRQMDLRQLLVHELGPLPWSLALFDGALVKTDKAALPKLLEDGVECLHRMPAQTTAVIIDAMAMLQTMKKIPERFSDLAVMIFKRMLMQAGQARRVDFVGDQYPVISIKNTERERRSNTGQLAVSITSSQQFCPRQWKKYLSCGSNKVRLLEFLSQEWSKQEYVERIDSRVMYVTHGNHCKKLVVKHGRMTATDETELYTDQEEADTRMFLHASHASSHGHQRVAIVSSDTDVEVLACHHQSAIPAELTLISGTRNRSRLISVPRLCEKLGPGVCRVLPSLHALTGCDAVSSFAGRGKKKAFEMVRDNQVIRDSVGVLGESLPLSAHSITRLEEVVCRLYNDNLCKQVHDLRYKMFCKGKNVQSHQLPPTSAALHYHLKRANYQAFLWKKTLQPRIEQEPVNHGWQLNEGRLEIVWTDLAPAPQAVMELVCCGCRGNCQTRRCSCVGNGLPCTEACTCSEDCTNSATDLKDGDDDVVDNDEDEND